MMHESDGYRVHWLHPTSADRFIGDKWDRATADHIARMLERAGCRDVSVRRWSR